MKNVSLMKLSAFVVMAAAASVSVNAESRVSDANSTPVVTEAKAVTTKAVDLVSPDALFAPLDVDKNGLITEQELGGTQSELLKEQFRKIDVNNDKGISEKELKDFLAKVAVNKS